MKQLFLSGGLDGQSVWVVDFRLNKKDAFKKPARRIIPTQVLVRSNDELPPNKTIYYADYHFVVFKTNGTLSSKIISLFDNTGFRSFTGTPLEIYKTKTEAVTAWNRLSEDVRKEIEVERFKMNQKYDLLIDQAFNLRLD